MATTVPLLFIGMVGVGLLGGWLGERQISLLGGRWLDAKLDEVMRVVRENNDVLVRFGLEKVEANVEDLQAAAWKALGGVAIGAEGVVFVVDADGAVLMHSGQDGQESHVGGEPWFSALAGHERGQVAFSRGEIPYLGVFRHFPPWKCYVLVAAPQHEVLGAVGKLRRYVLGCALLVAVLVSFLVMLLARRITQPLYQLMEGHRAHRPGRPGNPGAG